MNFHEIDSQYSDVKLMTKMMNVILRMMVMMMMIILRCIAKDDDDDHDDVHIASSADNSKSNPEVGISFQSQSIRDQNPHHPLPEECTQCLPLEGAPSDTDTEYLI